MGENGKSFDFNDEHTDTAGEPRDFNDEHTDRAGELREETVEVVNFDVTGEALIGGF